jgi:hypothetical protein
MKFRVFDVGEKPKQIKDAELIAEVECTLGEIVGSPG